jgi:hypothetical protein
MKGFWMSRSGASGMRRSDGRLRRNVCIEALRRVGGMSIDKAASQVASILGKGTTAEVNAIRVAYYQRPPGQQSRHPFFFQFLDWRKWVFESDEETIQFVLDDYERQFTEPSRQCLAELMDDLRGDPEQRTRNRSWCLAPGEDPRTRIESGHWNSESDWQFLAIDLWVLGRLHAGIGEIAEAKFLLGCALDVWRTHGHKLAHQQAAAIPALEAEIARLSHSSKSPSEEA